MHPNDPLNLERPNILHVLTHLTTDLHAESGIHPSIALSQILLALECPLVHNTILSVAHFMADGLIPSPKKDPTNAA